MHDLTFEMNKCQNVLALAMKQIAKISGNQSFFFPKLGRPRIRDNDDGKPRLATKYKITSYEISVPRKVKSNVSNFEHFDGTALSCCRLGDNQYGLIHFSFKILFNSGQKANPNSSGSISKLKNKETLILDQKLSKYTLQSICKLQQTLKADEFSRSTKQQLVEVCTR